MDTLICKIEVIPSIFTKEDLVERAQEALDLMPKGPWYVGSEEYVGYIVKTVVNRGEGDKNIWAPYMLNENKVKTYHWLAESWSLVKGLLDEVTSLRNQLYKLKEKAI